jgi:hypothetical protein
MKTFLILAMALLSPQTEPDYAGALKPIVAASLQWIHENGHWATRGPVTVDVDSYLAALSQANLPIADSSSFRSRSGVTHAAKLADVLEGCGPDDPVCRIRDHGLNITVDSLASESDQSLTFYLTATHTAEWGGQNATCGASLVIPATRNPEGRWVPGKAWAWRRC